MSNITFEFACRDDCLDIMLPSDLRKIVFERDRLQAELTAAKAEIEKLQTRVVEVEEFEPEARLLCKQAMIAGRQFGRGDLTYSALRMFVEEYAQRNRQQADEIEENQI